MLPKSLFRVTPHGKTYEKRTWMGGKTPTKEYKDTDREFRRLRSAFFRELLLDCGGLDFWKCAGTGSIERARIFWKEATLDAFATLRQN